jgi:hypothetical protein
MPLVDSAGQIGGIMDFGILISVAGGLVAGVIVALKVIAPLTSSKLDDRILAVLEKLEGLKR